MNGVSFQKKALVLPILLVEPEGEAVGEAGAVGGGVLAYKNFLLLLPCT